MDRTELLLAEMTDAYGPPGHEEAISKIFKKHLEKLAKISYDKMGSVIAEIRQGLRSVPIPRNFTIGFGGDYDEQQKAFRELALGLGDGNLRGQNPLDQAGSVVVLRVPLVHRVENGARLVDDQRHAASRTDVLVWSTEPLREPIRVAGQPVALLFASTSGSDSD